VVESKIGLDKNKEFVAFLLDDHSRLTLKEVDFQEHQFTAQILPGDIYTAIDYLGTHRTPAILMIDISNCTLPLSDMGRLAQLCEPGVEVIVVSTANDVAVFRGLLKLGVQDYLVKPINTPLIAKTLAASKYINVQEDTNTQFSKYGHLLTFIGARGGVGVTTLAANFGGMFAHELSKRVCIMDLDLQAGMLAQLFKQTANPGLVELLSSPDKVDSNLINRLLIHVDGRLSLACGQNLNFDPNQLDPLAIKKTISMISENYHYTVVDCPRHTSTAVTNMLLKSSQAIFIVMDPTIYSIRYTSILLQKINENNIKNQSVYIILNRVGEYVNGALEPDTIEKVINNQIAAKIGYDNKAFLVAANQGQLVTNITHHIKDDLKSFMSNFTGTTTSKKNVKTSFLKKWLHK